MASEKQTEPTDATHESTGPRTQEGKARSRMNALRHGFASATQVRGSSASDVSRKSDGGGAYDCVNAVDLASDQSSELVEISKLNGDFKKNYGKLIGAYLYLRSVRASRGRPCFWSGLLFVVVSTALTWFMRGLFWMCMQ
jgi:hypothetical protein